MFLGDLGGIVGSEWRASIALSSAKSAVMVWGVVGWSEVNKLKSRGAATAP